MANEHPVVLATPKFRQVTDGLLAPERCEELITRLVVADPKTRPTVFATGKMQRNTREITFRDTRLAAELFAQLAFMMPQEVGHYMLKGVSPAFRVFEHKPGCFFGQHQDGSIEVGSARSIYTLLVYLSGDVEGGETVFVDDLDRVAPAVGRGLIFNHLATHYGDKVRSGVKYTLRSDILYQYVDS